MVTPKMALVTALASAAMLLAQPSLAGTVYSADFTGLNDSGVTGSATLALNDTDTMLTVHIVANGLEAGQPHVAHIHGLVDSSGMPLKSVTPPLSADTDHDGYVELAEGAAFYGPILIPLVGFDSAETSSVDYTHTFDLLSSSTYAPGFDRTSLLGPNLNELDLRELVIHGLTVPDGPGAGTPGEVDGSGGYKAVLPVASAEIAAVPEPATWALMICGLLALGAVLRTRRTLQVVAA